MTDANAPFVVLDGEEKERSAVGGFVADAPGIGQVAGVVRNVCAIERGDGDDGELGTGFE